ncbi:MAG: OmpA family protein [Flavobacteriales bacterium]|nr:OmpA family protein [Flavobacteriales bacterium]
MQFDFDKATLLPGHEDELDKLVDVMTDYPFVRAEIEGHTDDQGSDSYNLQLSDDRAKAVVDYLLKKKVDKERLTWKAMVKASPKAQHERREPRGESAGGIQGGGAVTDTSLNRCSILWNNHDKRNDQCCIRSPTTALGLACYPRNRQ